MNTAKIKDKKYVEHNYPDFKSSLIEAACEGNWRKINIDNIPKQLITKGLYFHPWYDIEAEIMINLITLAIVKEKTKEFPIDLLSQQSLTAPDKTGMTALHYAGKLGQLKYIPKQYLTKENFCIPDNGGNTPLHYAILSRSYGQIPKELKIPDLLEIKNNEGFCGFDFALFGLEEPKKWTMSPIEKENGIKEAKAQIKLILSTSDNKTLNKFARADSPSIPKPKDLDNWGAKWGIYPNFEELDNQKRDYSKKALVERKIKQSLSKTEKSIEI